jgi:cardiolipin-specific phospholipase
LKDLPAEEKAKDNGSAKVMVTKKAGHHVYLDGWKEFNEVMLKEMDEVSRSEKPDKLHECDMRSGWSLRFGALH